MVVEEIIVRVSEKGVAKLKNLIGLQENLEKVKRGGGNVDRSLTRVNKRINKLTGGAKGVALQFQRFKFELLGVLFFGMAVSRFMKGLLKPALEVTGAFEILTFILQDFFLPAAEGISEQLDKIATKLEEIPEPVQEFVNWLVILGVILGTGLLLLGIFGLAINSLAVILGTTAVGVLLFAGGIILIGALIIGLILLFKNWEKITTKIKLALSATIIVIGGILLAFSPIIGVIILLIGAFILLKTGWDALRKSLGTTGFKDTLIAAFNKIIEKINEFIGFINQIPFVDIPLIRKIEGGTFVDELGGTTFSKPGPASLGPVGGGDSFFNITINTTNGIDEVNLKEELKAFINETNAAGLTSISRGLP